MKVKDLIEYCKLIDNCNNCEYIGACDKCFGGDAPYYPLVCCDSIDLNADIRKDDEE